MSNDKGANGKRVGRTLRRRIKQLEERRSQLKISSLDSYRHCSAELTLEMVAAVADQLAYDPVNLVAIGAYELANGSTDEFLLQQGKPQEAGYPLIAVLYPLNQNNLEGRYSASQGPKPFPTTLWMTCPILHAKVSKLEDRGWVQKLQSRLLTGENSVQWMESMRKAHERYARFRWNLLSEEDKELVHTNGWDDALMGVGIAGMREVASVKCLHCHYAHYLAKPGHGNIIGRWVHELLQEMDSEPSPSSSSSTGGGLLEPAAVEDTSSAATAGAAAAIVDDAGTHKAAEAEEVGEKEAEVTIQMERSRPRKSFPITEGYNQWWMDQQRAADDAEPGEVDRKFLQCPERRHCSAATLALLKDEKTAVVGSSNPGEESSIGNSEDSRKKKEEKEGKRRKSSLKTSSSSSSSSSSRRSPLVSPRPPSTEKIASRGISWGSHHSYSYSRSSSSGSGSGSGSGGLSSGSCSGPSREIFMFEGSPLSETPMDRHTTGDEPNMDLCRCVALGGHGNHSNTADGTAGGVEGGEPNITGDDDGGSSSSNNYSWSSSLCPAAPSMFATSSCGRSANNSTFESSEGNEKSSRGTQRNKPNDNTPTTTKITGGDSSCVIS